MYSIYYLQELSVTKEVAILNLRLNEATDPMQFVRLVSCGPQEQKWRFTELYDELCPNQGICTAYGAIRYSTVQNPARNTFLFKQSRNTS